MNEFDWREFLNYAKKVYDKLKTVGTDFDDEQEALCRIGISRAYYAAFHGAKNFLESTSVLNRQKDEGSHEVVINALRKQKNTDLQDVGEELNDLKTRRVRADYQADCYCKNSVKPFDELEMAVDSAENILDVIDRKSLQLLKKKKF